MATAGQPLHTADPGLVLAWARVDGASPIAGHSVVAFNGSAPSYLLNGVAHVNEPDRLQEEQNGAHVFAANSIGNPTTAADDVFVDGQFITAQNYNSARLFGQVLAQHLHH